MSIGNAKHLTVGGKNAVRLEIDGSCVWKGLPKGYTPLDHIEATGTQHIDLDFKPNQNSRLVCEVLYLGGAGVMGARNSTASNNHAVRVIRDKWQFGYGDGLYSSEIDADSTEWHIFDLNKNAFYIDGILAVECVEEAFQCSYPYALGGIKAGSMYYGRGRYRACQVYDNGVLIRDCVPCINPYGEVGMYDTLNAKFYGNAGTGEFIAGYAA